MNISVGHVFGREDCEVAVIGAGPYGLAAAAHLRAAGIETRIFGEAFSFWRDNMPKGMRLRSPWNASHICDPQQQYSLDAYCRALGIGKPAQLPRELFLDYGAWFKDHVAPDLDSRRVLRVEAAEDGFRLVLADGYSAFARRVIVATGLLGQEYRPDQFHGLPRSLVSHSCEHSDFGLLRGRRVAVIGRGQSACESAALLHESGAQVEIVCQGQVDWIGDTNKRSALRKKLRALLGNLLIPPSQVGPFPLSWLIEAPGLVRRLPDELRDDTTERCLHATAADWLRPRLADVPVHDMGSMFGVRREGERIALTIDGTTSLFDHVVLGTGYRPDLGKVGPVAALAPRIRTRAGYPVLSGDFESSVPGLHFIGANAVGSFGPLLRFIAGSGYAARRVTGCARRNRGDLSRRLPAHAIEHRGDWNNP
jgi:cation diffusion facilitator CzcD-associated flavoprotein CzcO